MMNYRKFGDTDYNSERDWFWRLGNWGDAKVGTMPIGWESG